MDPASCVASVVNKADYYKWDSPSGDFSVLLRLELVDGVFSEVMAAFSALPRRGAETGGILLGRIEQIGPATIVHLEGFDCVPCSYRRGPSYLLCESEVAAFEAAVRKHSGAQSGICAVGYYRSHTRDLESLADDDRTLLARFFPPPNGVMLVIQPRASRPTTAGFVAYENGQLANWPAMQFPFSRRAPVAATPVPRDPARARPHARLQESPVAHDFSFAGYAASPKQRPPTRRRTIRTNVWASILAALFCLLLGLAAGIAARPRIPALNPPDHDPFVLSLSAKRSGGKLLISWDRDCPAVRYAQRGTLEIIDGQFTRRIELSANELQTGSVVFHNSSEHVSLRLEILIRELSKIADVIRWDYEPPR